MKARPIAIAVMALSSAATFAFANTSDKSTPASNPGYSTSLSQPSSASSQSASASLQSDNATISQMQQALNDKGYNVGSVDGQMGPKTKSALKKFQQAQGLQQSGQVDSQTVAALNLASSGPNASSELSSSSQGSTASAPSATSQGTNGSSFSPQPPQQQQQQQQQQPQSQQQPKSSSPS